MSKGAISKKNKEMAAYLKARGVRRTGMNCPICHRQVGIGGFENHLRTCKGRSIQ